MTLPRLLREPLLHFLLIGAGLFVLFGLFGKGGERPDRIVMTRGEVDQLVAGWERTWQRSPTEAELAGLVNDWVREQVYAREAVALGLDENDIVIRRRLRQKMEFLVDDLADAAPPTEEELSAFLAGNPDRFREPALLTFRQVYVSVDRRGAGAWAYAERLRDELRRAGEAVPDDLGDPLPVAPGLEAASPREVSRLFGDEFAAAVAAQAPGDWQGPIHSGYGLHLVRVTERTEPRLPALDEVRDEVVRDLAVERRNATAERFYEAIRSRYDIVLEDDPRVQPGPADGDSAVTSTGSAGAAAAAGAASAGDTSDDVGATR